MTVTNRPGFVLAALGAVTCAVVLGAPQASAAVTNLEIVPNAADCSYTITATAQPGTAVSFFDTDDKGFGTRDTFQPDTPAVDASGKATTTWKPGTKGQHKIYAQESPTADATFTQIVNVDQNPTCGKPSTGSAGLPSIPGIG
ncbi:hypothetical protein [Nocardia sp. XZ_19_385]|uniref:hypothetical protein n=1 Tax=Nocardia sp. XZ_19_385 TaxID=2769488 RepID=UPI00188DCA3C|nr:hypothetical protein [Nocardia sp. XZ_19_385]